VRDDRGVGPLLGALEARVLGKASLGKGLAHSDDQVPEDMGVEGFKGKKSRSEFYNPLRS
jgi:hypothetical protein